MRPGSQALPLLSGRNYRISNAIDLIGTARAPSEIAFSPKQSEMRWGVIPITCAGKGLV